MLGWARVATEYTHIHTYRVPPIRQGEPQHTTAQVTANSILPPPLFSSNRSIQMLSMQMLCVYTHIHIQGKHTSSACIKSLHSALQEPHLNILAMGSRRDNVAYKSLWPLLHSKHFVFVLTRITYSEFLCTATISLQSSLNNCLIFFKKEK